MQRLARWTATALIGCIAGVSAFAPTADARNVTYTDENLGYEIKVDDQFDKVPPKLTGRESYVVGDWGSEKAKYARSMAPQFTVTWWVLEDRGPVTGKPSSEGTGGVPSQEDIEEMMSRFGQPKSFDAWIDWTVQNNQRFFGPQHKIEELWKDPDDGTTRDGLEFEYVEYNGGRKPEALDGTEPEVYLFAARLIIERPGSKVLVGFRGISPVSDSKKYSKLFKYSVKSFELLDEARDSKNALAGKGPSDDPSKFRDFVKSRKVIKGWKTHDTENYLLLYDEEVDEDLVRDVARQIEAIREQIYEVLFPPDAPITAVSVVRICKDRAQYMRYGAPGGSAGYWSPGEKELVFYDDNSDDSLRVLYHEAFHQYIHYSVGDFAPHSWFNEGHGDFFAGHDFKRGKFHEEEFQWRKGLAATLKSAWKNDLKDDAEKKFPDLVEWLSWPQGRYYGRNEYGLAGGQNYALGWSFVWFLRTTRKEEYQQILPTYFDTLKGLITAERDRIRALLQAGKSLSDPDGDEPEDEGTEGDEGAPPVPPGPDGEPVEPPKPPKPPAGAGDADEGLSDEDAWNPEQAKLEKRVKRAAARKNPLFLQQALEEAFKGIDLDQLLEDWLDD